MDVLSVEKDWLWTIIYILLVTIIWPLAVLIFSFFFGQFKFFKGYVKRLGQKIRIVRSSQLEGGSLQFRVLSSKSSLRTEDAEGPLTTHHSPLTINIAIFASGAGSNAQRIIDHFRNSPVARIVLIVCNKKKAGVLQIAEKENIPSLVIKKEEFFSGVFYLDKFV